MTALTTSSKCGSRRRRAPLAVWKGVGVMVLNNTRARIGQATVMAVLAVLGATLVGCSGSSEEPAAESASTSAAVAAPTAAPQPTSPPTAAPKAAPTVAPAPTAAAGPTPYPTPAPVATRPPVVVEMQPKSDLPLDQQIAKLSELVLGHLTGINNIERPRLNLPPDVRDDRRRGGIVVNIEFNGDEYETTTEKKAGLDLMMREMYHVLYASGYDITEATMSAVMMGTAHRNVGGASTAPITVYKSRLKRDAAEGIDWGDKENLDFNEIWDTILLSPVWKRELKAESGG